MPNSIKFCDRFKNLLKTSGMTETQVANTLGLSQSAVNYYKNGRSEPKGWELYRIAKLFGVTIEWLLTGEEQKQNDSATQMWRERALLAESKLEIVKDGMKAMLKKI
ncbi:MAG: helix-turn-helix transcriptional regulator [Opitutales bacterium]|nr:helix-turn-helix transcriptional regulator [Opitutales bacterium]